MAGVVREAQAAGVELRARRAEAEVLAEEMQKVGCCLLQYTSHFIKNKRFQQENA